MAIKERRDDTIHSGDNTRLELPEPKVLGQNKTGLIGLGIAVAGLGVSVMAGLGIAAATSTMMTDPATSATLVNASMTAFMAGMAGAGIGAKMSDVI